MAHYAFLNETNRVVEVIVGKHEYEDGVDWEQYYGQVRGLRCIRTSYNANIRGKFAGIGDYYNQELDQFVSSSTISMIDNSDASEE